MQSARYSYTSSKCIEPKEQISKSRYQNAIKPLYKKYRRDCCRRLSGGSDPVYGQYRKKCRELDAETVLKKIRLIPGRRNCRNEAYFYVKLHNGSAGRCTCRTRCDRIYAGRLQFNMYLTAAVRNPAAGRCNVRRFSSSALFLRPRSRPDGPWYGHRREPEPSLRSGGPCGLTGCRTGQPSARSVPHFRHMRWRC